MPLLTQLFFFYIYFYAQYLMNSYVQSLLNIPFYAGTRGNRQRVLQYIVQTVTNFLLLSRENKKN